ncbi:MAG: GTPase ObgE [Oscillospiraceae bacterium]|nr:GTPase ObgE [Oscillospiraceae bacterium]
MFIDVAKIKVKAGDGGDGAVSFRREKYVPAGGPNGGDGGKGGNIIIIADSNLSTLTDFQYKKTFFAKNGERGGNSNKTGKSGDDLIIKVPPGVLVKEAESKMIMADISTDEPVIIAHGGQGGKGNAKFATPTRQAPRFAKPGYPGEEFELILELKLLADAGIVGFPNAGKSTLISAVSAARPKIANYHFTTLSPALGVVRVGEERSFVMADIPGLIKGASEGAGLGHRFLRHIERCRLIVHLVDISGHEGRDPCNDYEAVLQELKNFNPELAERPQIVVGNKCDIADSESITAFTKYIENKNQQLYTISAATSAGIRELVNVIYQKLSELPAPKPFAVEYVPPAPENGRMFNVTREGDIYVVDAPWLEPVLHSVNIDDYESLQYFQRVLRSSGIIDKLEEMGIEDGEVVNIMGLEFNYRY